MKSLVISTAFLLSLVKPVQAQVVFSSRTIVPDTSTVRHGQASFRVSCFESVVNLPPEDLPKVFVGKRDIDSLLACFADSVFKEVNAPKPSAENRTNQLQFIPAIPPLRLLSRQEYRVSNKFGWRIHPIGGNAQHHNGIDIVQPAGTPVYATASGVVKWVSWDVDGLGLAVCIQHPTGYESIYGHLSTHAVREREVIQRGALVGQVGSTGRSTGPHLHYTVLFQGKPVDPEQYCFLWIKLARVKSPQAQHHRLNGPDVFQKGTKTTVK